MQKGAQMGHPDAVVDQFDIHPSAYIAPQTFLAGRITIGPDSSVWPMSVLRADECAIIIGARTNLQDGCIVHGDYGVDVVIGDRVTVGHGAILHSTVIEDDVLIGIGAVVLSHTRIGKGSLVAARALIPEGMEVPPGSLVIGIPGKIKPLAEAHAARIARGHDAYVHLKNLYQARQQG
jgi:carbonic anhydrase/acetyltransferase-like protein (isoleucine patch superfamily)